MQFSFRALAATPETPEVEKSVRRDYAGHDRKIPVHVRLDRHAEGRDQHPAHADLEPAGQGADLDVPRGYRREARHLDWLPWSHTFGANHNFNLVLRNGGTLYVDGGKPAPGCSRPRLPICAA
jgi:feruloyl-CoA synthase